MVSSPGIPGPATKSAGERLFSRYAYAPNHLGYCGPAEADALFELASTGRTDADVHAIARGFSGAWPYSALLAELSGIEDALDERVQRAYWTGGELLDQVDPETFGRKLLEVIGPRAGHYWAHLTEDLLPEAMPTHNFHVFGVYPWTRLLAGEAGRGPADVPVTVLDSCRIRWGQVVAVRDDQLEVSSRPLTWDGDVLGLGDAAPQVLPRGPFVPDPRPGQWLALHWDIVCEHLTDDQADELQRRTDWQLARTNERLTARRPGAAGAAVG